MIYRSKATSPTPNSAGTAELLSLPGGKPLRLPSYRHDGTSLLPEEVWWRVHQPWLKEHGYQLRPRYQPDWKASWKGRDSSSSYWKYEDGLMIPEHEMLDATRTHDGELVLLRRVSTARAPDELRIHQHLLESKVDGKEHIVPIYEILQVPDGSQDSVVVLPFLRPSSDPVFRTMEEVVQFFTQVFKGLQFMHNLHVTHGSCNFKGMNIMMDPKPMFPNMHHPVALNRSSDFTQDAEYRSRTEVAGALKYYWPRGFWSNRKPQVYAADIRELGIMIRENFTTKDNHFAFMRPLIEKMTAVSPSARPTIDAVITEFETLLNALPAEGLAARLGSEGPRLPLLSRLWTFNISTVWGS